MKAGNVVGCIAMAIFALSFFVSDRMSSILGLLSIGLFLAAAWLRPRMWLLGAGAIAALAGLMFLILRNRD